VLRRTVSSLAAAALAVALALSLVACGGVSETLDPVASAADKSSDAGSFRVEIDASFTAGGKSGGFVANGVFDEDEGELTVDASELLQQLPGGLGGGDAQMKLIVTKEDDRPVIYLNFPAAMSVLPGGMGWIKADVEKAASLAGGNTGQLLGLSGQNPKALLELLGKSGTVVEVGRDTIDGAAVTHYRVDVDLKKALEQQGAPPEALAALIASGASTEVPVDVWIGVDDGYVHRVALSYGATVNGQDLSAEMTLTLSDWGTDVSIDVPPDDQVLDITALAEKLGKA
jgi:hypothetical protein